MSSSSLASRVFTLPELAEPPSPLEWAELARQLLSIGLLEVCFTFPSSHGEFARRVAGIVAQECPTYEVSYFLRHVDGEIAMKVCVKRPDL